MNMPLIFVIPISVVILIELVSGYALGAARIEQRKQSFLGYWLSILSHVLLLAVICWYYNL